jgi:aminopeptidase N
MNLRLEGESEVEAEAAMIANARGSDEGSNRRSTRILELREAEREFVFEGIDEEPVPSILRGFSAPVRLEMDRTRESLAFLMAHDDDPVNRWDAGQQLALELLVSAATEIASGRTPELDAGFSAAWVRVLGDESLDGSLRALALTLPGERVVAQEMDVIDPDAIHAAREFFGKALATAHADRLWSSYRALSPSGSYRHERSEIDRRRLRNCALRMLVWTGDEEATQAAWTQFQEADNMTDAQAAFVMLTDQDHEVRDRVIRAFYERWKNDPLVMDKWFSIQAGSSRTDTLARVRELTRHADFNLGNPNRVRSLIGAFCAGNQVRFHASSGEGYAFLTDYVLKLNESNPQVASRMVSVFNDWRRYGPDRQALMQAQLERIASSGTLSDDVYEIVNRALSR